MRLLRKALLAGAAALAAVGLAGVAAAQIAAASHVLDIRLPDGTRERIRYVGDTPPEVRLEPARAAAIDGPAFADPFGPGSPFAALRRLSAEMDRQAAAMLREAEGLPSMGGLMQADLGALPSGAQGFTVVSTMTGDGICTRTTRYVSAPGAAPKVVAHTSGQCGGAAAALAAPRPVEHAPGALQTVVQPAPRPMIDPALLHTVSAAD